MIEFWEQYRYLITPFAVWFGIQLFKLIWDLVTTKKLNLKRLMGAGGMPSSHSAVVVALATMIGRSQGITSPIFALSVIFAFVVMYDACGVRRETGKQAHILNEIIKSPGLTSVEVSEKLVELVGHTPFQVFAGAVIGLIIGLIF